MQEVLRDHKKVLKSTSHHPEKEHLVTVSTPAVSKWCIAMPGASFFDLKSIANVHSLAFTVSSYECTQMQQCSLFC